ncbi:MAG: ABC transporter ATP-binding protein [Bdellovibrionaceae bacterium]|nr:ABC transporter ATP-binding protein [Pseudobdellovibrionaceae bacterium]
MSLEIKDLSKSFTQGEQKIQVLQNLNFAIETGEVVSVIGQSGSGKSTFLSLVAGLDRVDSGHILVDQEDMTEMDETRITQFRASNISLVFQQYHLVSHLTALENVLLPLEITKAPSALLRANQILDEMGLTPRKNHLPTQLSGGECQRVAIARALVVRPKLLLADEPSGNLDIETGQKVMEVFFQMIRNYRTTALVVTHSETLARRCQKTFILKSGRLLETHP